MAFYEKWQSERYSIGCKVWEARCPNCHYLVESAEQISSNYRFCPYCGFDMKSEYLLRRITIDEAIAHCVEIVQKESCTQCAKDHQQLADWLMELKDLRAELNDNAIYIAELEAEISKLNAQHITRSDAE